MLQLRWKVSPLRGVSGRCCLVRSIFLHAKEGWALLKEADSLAMIKLSWGICSKARLYGFVGGPTVTTMLGHLLSRQDPGSQPLSSPLENRRFINSLKTFLSVFVNFIHLLCPEESMSGRLPPNVTVSPSKAYATLFTKMRGETHRNSAADNRENETF